MDYFSYFSLNVLMCSRTNYWIKMAAFLKVSHHQNEMEWSIVLRPVPFEFDVVPYDVFLFYVVYICNFLSSLYMYPVIVFKNIYHSPTSTLNA